jgi:hypothetical protein
MFTSIRLRLNLKSTTRLCRVVINLFIKNLRDMISTLFLLFVLLNDCTPLPYDVLITDVLEEDLESISVELGSGTYLSAATEVPPKLSVYGLIVNLEANRMFVNLVVKGCNGVNVNVPFLIGTSCPGVYLREDTLAASGYNNSLPPVMNFDIHGTSFIPCRLSGDHFKNVNLLGQSYFNQSRNRLLSDVFRKTVMILV